MTFICPKDNCAGGNTPLPEAMAQAMGMKCPVCGTQFQSPDEAKVEPVQGQPLYRFSEWPTPIALTIAEYFSEEHPGAKLWAACDTFEMLTRLLVIAFIAAESKDRKLGEDLRNRLSKLIESPTFGAWFVMAQDLASSNASKPSLAKAATYVKGALKDLLYGPEKPGTDETSFLKLRNRLAHGGGMTRKEQARLMDLWAGRIDSALESLGWMDGWQLIGKDGSGNWLNLCGEGRGSPMEPPAGMEANEPDRVWLLAGGDCLPLWPLAAFGIPRLQTGDKEKVGKRECPQVYVRREPVRLGLSPLGAEGMGHSESSVDAVAAFEDLFKPSSNAQTTHFKIHDFEREIRKDGGQMVGRADELDILEGMVHGKKTGVLWLSGQAGMGKSFLVAKLAVELLDSLEGTGRIFLPYRFRAGEQDRCNRDAFTQFVVERLEAAGALADYFEDKPKEKAGVRLQYCINSLKKETSLVLLLDGLDEVARRDPEFAEEVPLAIRHPHVLWLCTGRPEPGIVEPMKRLGGVTVFPEGLPPMREADIRGMVLEKIGPLRKKLLAGEKEQEDTVVNPFIRLVTERAAGLPTYVKYVIGDVLSGRYRVLDGEEALPDSLHAYHEELLCRLGIGDLQAVLTPLAATLATSFEPLALHELTAILSFRKILTGDEASALVEKGLVGMESMVSTAPNPVGEVGYQLFHQSLRDHILQSTQMSHSVQTAKGAFGELAELDSPPPELSNYLLRCGVRHLLDADRKEAAEIKLLDLDYLDKIQQQGLQWYEIYGYWEQLGGAKGANQYIAKVKRIVDLGTDTLLLEKVDRLVNLANKSMWLDCALNLSLMLLEFRLETHGQHHQDVASTYNKLGHAYHAMRKWRAAIDSFEKSVDILLEMHPEGHNDLYRYYNNLGAAHLSNGNYGNSMDLFKKSLDILLENENMNLVDIAGSYFNIGLIHHLKCEYDQAIKCYKTSISYRSNCLGNLHPDIADSHNNIGAVYQTIGEFDLAINSLKESLIVYMKTLGITHTNTQDAFFNLGVIYDSTGNQNLAMEYNAMGKWCELTQEGQFVGDDIDPKEFLEQVGIEYNRAKEILEASTHNP